MRKTRLSLQAKVTLALLAGTFTFMPATYAMPELAAGGAGANVVMQQTDNTLGISSADANNLLKWNKFSIGETEKVVFDANNYLNLVTGKEMSSILGELTGGGNIFLINPNGILFGANARIDAGAFYASTRNIENIENATYDSVTTAVLQSPATSAGGDLVNMGQIKADTILLEGGRVTIKNYANLTNSAGEILNSTAVTIRAKTEDPGTGGGIHLGYMGGKYEGPTLNYTVGTIGEGAAAIRKYQLISTLDELRANSYQGYLMFNNDLGSSDSVTDFEPIDANHSPKYVDGLGYKIMNLRINSDSAAGLWKRLDSTNIVIENFTMVNPTVSSTAGYANVGSVAGTFNASGGVMRNVTVENGDVSYTAGSDLTSAATVYAGGLVGSFANGQIVNGSYTGKVTVVDDKGGMLASVGGLTGDMTGGAQISASRHSGEVSVSGGTDLVIGNVKLGGLSGGGETKNIISDSHNDGTISLNFDNLGTSASTWINVGGLVGRSGTGGNITDSSNQAGITVTGKTLYNNNGLYVGGIRGGLRCMGRETADITGTFNTGAIDVTLTGDVTSGGQDSGVFVGGILGHFGSYGSNTVTLSEDYNAGNITVTGVNATGTNSNGKFNGYGGLVGFTSTQPLAIVNSYNTGKIAADADNRNISTIGGILGRSISNNVNVGIKINNVYDVGNGSIVGTAGAGSMFPSDVTNAFYATNDWNGTAFSRLQGGNNEYGTGRNWVEMAKAATYADWGTNSNDFGNDAVSTIGGADTVWRIYEDHTAPLLRRFLTQTDLGYTKEYNGSAQTLTYGELQAKYAKGIGITDGSTVAAEAQVLATATDVGSVDYASTELARMLWSNQQGYDIVATNGFRFSIAPKKLHLTFAKAADDTTAAPAAAATLSGLVNEEDAALSGSGRYLGKTEGTDYVVLTEGLSLTGSKATNYELPAVAVGRITPPQQENVSGNTDDSQSGTGEVVNPVNPNTGGDVLNPAEENTGGSTVVSPTDAEAGGSAVTPADSESGGNTTVEPVNPDQGGGEPVNPADELSPASDEAILQPQNVQDVVEALQQNDSRSPVTRLQNAVTAATQESAGKTENQKTAVAADTVRSRGDAAETALLSVEADNSDSSAGDDNGEQDKDKN